MRFRNSPSPDARLGLRCFRAQLDRWRAAAHAAGLSLTAWVIDRLSKAAHEEEVGRV